VDAERRDAGRIEIPGEREKVRTRDEDGEEEREKERERERERERTDGRMRRRRRRVDHGSRETTRARTPLPACARAS